MTQAKVRMLGLEAIGDRPMQVGLVWAPPIVDLQGDNLIYNLIARKTRQAGTNLLANFIALAQATDLEIFRYAQQWGALEVGKNILIEKRSSSELYYAEPTSDWRRLARRFAAGLAIGAEMAQGRPGQPETWLLLDHARYSGAGPGIKIWELALSARHQADLAHGEMQIVIRKLIEEFNLRPRFWFNRKAGQWQLDLEIGRAHV